MPCRSDSRFLKDHDIFGVEPSHLAALPSIAPFFGYLREQAVPALLEFGDPVLMRLLVDVIGSAPLIWSRSGEDHPRRKLNQLVHQRVSEFGGYMLSYFKAYCRIENAEVL